LRVDIQGLMAFFRSLPQGQLRRCYQGFF